MEHQPNPRSNTLRMGTRLGARSNLSSNSRNSGRFVQLPCRHFWDIPKSRTNPEMGKERKARRTSSFVSILSEFGKTLLLFAMEASLVCSSSLRLSCYCLYMVILCEYIPTSLDTDESSTVHVKRYLSRLV